jgi:hypothetical protein
MHTITEGTLDTELTDKLEWISATAAAHRAAASRLAGAQTERERREAAYEEALTKEMHRAAVSRLGAV